MTPETSERQQAGGYLSASIVTYHSDLTLFERLLHTLISELDSFDSRDSGDSGDSGGSDSSGATLYLVCNDADPAYERAANRLLAEADTGGKIELITVSGHGNIGYGAAHNLAIERTESRYHLILNPDVELDGGALSAATDYLQSHDECSLVAPQGYSESGHYLRLAKRYPTLFVLACRAFSVSADAKHIGGHIRRYTYNGELPAQNPFSIELASGCCMLCRTDALHLIKGFDERYFLFFEDYDLSIRLRGIGNLVELPGFRIKHFGGWATKREMRRLAHFTRSMLRFFNRHGWRVF